MEKDINRTPSEGLSTRQLLNCLAELLVKKFGQFYWIKKKGYLWLENLILGLILLNSTSALV